MMKTIIQLLDKYVEIFQLVSEPKNALTGISNEILRKLPEANDPNEFELIVKDMWDKYFCVSVDALIAILRRWLEIEPNNKEARHALGTFLLSHGPDWDEEGQSLLQNSV